MPPAAVGFDLDDTLCVPDRDRGTLLADAVTEADAPPLEEWASREAYQAAHGSNLTSESRTPVFAAMLDGTAVSADPAALATAYRETVNDALRPLAGVEGLLAGLRERYRVGLLTNGPRRAQRSKLETLGLTDAFDASFVTGELPAGKPDRRAFEALLDGLDVEPDELVYVGDDVDADVGGATAAGCRAIQVLHDGGPDPDPRAAAHVRFDELARVLPGVLEELD
ncbi:MAG: HAD family hydrolase [Halobacteriales archaeon]|nr:HAD family hydrolase [Halobacteriales archaeon]